MNAQILDRVAPVYDIKKSLWYGTHKTGNFKLALCFYSRDGNTMSFPLSCISSYIKSRFTDVEIHIFPVLTSMDEYAYSVSGIADTIFQWKPDLIAVSLMSVQWDGMDDYLRRIKSKNPEVPVLIGGYQAILNPQQTINHPAVDFVCVGDGEIPVADLIMFLRGDKKGHVYGLWEKMTDESVFCTDPVQINDINTLPFPDYDIYYEGSEDFSFYSSTGSKERNFLPAMNGRGCPYRCTYCCNSAMMDMWKDRKYFLRRYDPVKYTEELRRMKEKYNYDFIEFWYEHMLFNSRYINEFIKHYSKNVGLPFTAWARVETLSEDMCIKVADGGCYLLCIGIESGNEEYRRKVLNRKMSNKQILDAVDNCRKVGIKVLTYNMVGMPFETKEMAQESLDFTKRIAPEYANFFTYIPMRGTKLYRTAEKAGLILSKKYYSSYEQESNSRARYTLNIKEHDQGMTNDEFNEIWQEIYIFQLRNNRLAFNP